MKTLWIYKKAKNKIREAIIRKFRRKALYPKLYKAYWHKRIAKSDIHTTQKNYYSAEPNPGAGIGHQIANWIAGYWYAQQFNLRFAHTPFPSAEWEHLLGFGSNETTVNELIQHQGYKKVKLPLFDENNSNEVQLQREIIESYSNAPTVFIAEQDQFYGNQYGVIDNIKQKFYSADLRQNDNLIYSNHHFNIAVHVRRGNLSKHSAKQNSNLSMRWLDETYFSNILNLTLKSIKINKPIQIFVFSQGEVDDFKELKDNKNIHFCLNMNVVESFLHMVFADILITSKSSFSYKPALLSNGIKICPADFWHGYPETNDFILADNLGNFNTILLSNNLILKDGQINHSFKG